MLKRALALPVAILTLTWTSAERAELSADITKPLISSLESDDDVCLMPPTLEQRAEYQAAIAAYQSRRGAAASDDKPSNGAPPGWPGKNTIGGNIPPISA
ncbi:MAG TPA: hypothetical protein VNR64_17330, partial [Vicinamibacterales bacterium]|nr:hypothetical protein [Vicinamibacterales bacterium]